MKKKKPEERLIHEYWDHVGGTLVASSEWFEPGGKKGKEAASWTL